MALMCFFSLSVVVFFFLFQLLVVMRLWVWICDFGGLFFFFFFRLLVMMRLWICDLVVILEGCFSFYFSGCWWLMVMRLWVWVCDLVMILVASGHGCRWW